MFRWHEYLYEILIWRINNCKAYDNPIEIQLNSIQLFHCSMLFFCIRHCLAKKQLGMSKQTVCIIIAGIIGTILVQRLWKSPGRRSLWVCQAGCSILQCRRRHTRCRHFGTIFAVLEDHGKCELFSVVFHTQFQLPIGFWSRKVGMWLLHKITRSSRFIFRNKPAKNFQFQMNLTTNFVRHVNT